MIIKVTKTKSGFSVSDGKRKMSVKGSSLRDAFGKFCQQNEEKGYFSEVVISDKEAVYAFDGCLLEVTIYDDCHRIKEID